MHCCIAFPGQFIPIVNPSHLDRKHGPITMLRQRKMEIVATGHFRWRESNNFGARIDRGAQETLDSITAARNRDVTIDRTFASFLGSNVKN